MGEEATFRPARREDCAKIAALYSIASDGVANYIRRKLAGPGKEPLEVGERRYAREDTAFTYKSCVLAERDGEVIGMLAAFPMEPGPAAGEPDEDVDPVLAPYGELERPGSFYVCAMAVFPEHRGRGVGTRMLELAWEQARERGLEELSLIVFEQNAGAKRLYERHGFEEVDRRPVVPHELIRHTGDALPMVADVRGGDR